MHFTLSLLALAGAATAQIRGFNYGALYADNRARMLSDWEADFRAAQELPGVGAFTSARLFTMVQGYSQSDIISALPAAVATNTSLLLGLWCSGGDAAFQNEITALRAAVQQYGEQLQGKILGISIGSEDLYRISPTGIENESGPGAGPQQLVNYVSQAREAIQGTAWADVPIGHVDTWTAYVNASNNPLIEALDFLGVDAYPYFETVNENSIENAEGLFFDAYDATVGASMGKPVWVTETGWPVTGPRSGAATSGTENAEKYWKAVACKLLGKTNTFWYQLNDGADQEVSFKVIPADRRAPLYDLSCEGADTTQPTASASGSRSATQAAATATGSSATSGGAAAGTPNDDAQNAAQSGASSGSGSSSSGSGSSSSGSGSSSSGSSFSSSGSGSSSSGSSSGSSSSGQQGTSSGSGSSYQPAAGNNATQGNTTYTGPSYTGSNPSSYTGGASAMVGSAASAMVLAAAAAVAFL
ncbi:putative glucan endo-1,3-beta-glucosidase eglC [Fulvia fulva]|uniref:glucan endo-1,3-beta-D-glucosidase n=1 Tax=Passalora fulva TaxID=5499 RepID=A0A1P8YXT5_PASFU|nr:putative glucan endo-1,3-beta-glucosidase eglC [Fulvia fulva]AQA29330.1 hypothetical protein 37 [Fulvia fulva]KAK4619358.1 putative glucan endo-1,3-beta-glucosidase eglC [Fulvia fulva]KAK4620792.1 putative glucan endo-1,3-beta-glucosidase eglC [Fulvia fulva]UJO20245.1 putative glucan endo-1,3-beta-glucosidase eglC [Fulvia fulva]WPV17141.1 putative glucan endo-1,3-beta-glucosidase eglC [Fulvia fulva]